MSDRQPATILAVEAAGVDVIPDSARNGTARQLFWPWFAANVSVLGISYGAWALDFGISPGQAVLSGVLGIIASFLLCGIVALAGKRGSAPTMVLSRAALGVRGNRVAAGLSWLLTVGWETVLVALATLATGTVLTALGWAGGGLTSVVALIVVAGLTIAGGVIGFDLIMRMQAAITVVAAVLTLGYLTLTLPRLDLAALQSIPAGSSQSFLGALVFMMTGFGLGWVNLAADYSRYLPRETSGGAVIWWTTFGGALGPIVLLTSGVLLAGSDPDLRVAVSTDPIGALTTILPTWFLLPFALVAVLGLVGGAVLGIYSSGLALVATGAPLRRPVAAAVDGLIMVAGTLYIVFGSQSFFAVFQGFLITLGVPVAGWAGIMLADVLLRRAPYAEPDLFDPRGRYGDVQVVPLAIMALATGLGWGLVTNATLSWQGYLLDPVGLGGREGAWAHANLGVLLALLAGFFGTVLLRRRAVRGQELETTTPAERAHI